MSQILVSPQRLLEKLGCGKFLIIFVLPVLAAIRMARGFVYYYRLSKDVCRLLGKNLVVLGMGAVLAKATWDQRALLASYIR